MKEEAGTSSFVNLKCLQQAIYMLILNPSKINTKFQEIFKKYQKIVNYGSLICPCCKSKEYIKWGFYERGVTYFKNGKVVSEIIFIQRILCKSCKKTHALLPIGIVPYKQLTTEIFLGIFLNEITEDIFSFDSIQLWKKQLRKYHVPYLSSILKTTSIFQMLNRLKKETLKILERYIQQTNQCFMQIKMGYLGYCTS